MARQIVGAGFIPAREAAEEVLRELIDARLLTSYEVREEDEEPTRRVEIIHESLLANWPRLVRWQTQDAGRRPACATSFDRRRGRGTSTNARTTRLWTDTAYREFAVWRERYPGGLTKIEEAFAAAMTSLATRRRRRRRVAAASVVVFLTLVATALGALWRRSVLETRRAEAQKLLALAQVQLDTDPTEALAYATSSLELADTYEARIFAVRALWAGPPVRALDLQRVSSNWFMVPTFSPDGRWLAVAGLVSEYVLVYGEHGGEPIVLGGHAVSAAGPIRCFWTGDGLLVTGHRTEGRARIWSMPEGRLVREIELGGNGFWQAAEGRLLAGLRETDANNGHTIRRLRAWGLRDGGPEELGEVDLTALEARNWIFDPSGDAWLYSKGDAVYSLPLPITQGVPGTMIARHSSDEFTFFLWRRAEGLYSVNNNGEIILWTTADGTSVPGRRLRKPETAPTSQLHPDPSGRWAVEPPDASRLHLWDLEGLAGANPWTLRRGNPWHGTSNSDFHPSGHWVVATTNMDQEVSFWPLSAPLPLIVDGWILWNITPDGRYLVTSNCEKIKDGELSVRLWPLPGTEPADVIDLRVPVTRWTGQGLVVDPEGEHVLVLGFGPMVSLLSVSGGEPRQLEGFPANDVVVPGGFSPSGRLVAAASIMSDGQATLRVWDLLTGTVRVYVQPKDPEAYEGYYAIDLSFVDETTLYTAGANGLLRWDLETGSFEQVLRAPPGGQLYMRMTYDRRKMLTYEVGPSIDRQGPVSLHDLRTGDVRSLNIPGKGLLDLSPDGTVWASGEEDGLIWVGRTDGGEPHVLIGHVGGAGAALAGGVGAAISPDLRWIASSSIVDETLRLWPMPDLSKPPLHTLPHDELIAKLHSLTNLRVVRDEESSTGWKVEVGPFPGWAEVPEW